MTTTELNVQMIACTVFVPPVDADGKPLFVPDVENQVPTPLGRLQRYDGQALAEFAGRLCYQSFHRPSEKTATNDTYLANTQRQQHGSIEEHASVSFYFDGLSRNCSHEIVRHRHFSYSQLSQRYVDGTNSAIVIPPAVLELDEPYRTTVIEMMEANLDKARETYMQVQEAMQLSGLKGKKVNQVARAVLPGQTATSMVMTGNYRAWKGFLVQRDSVAADPEIRQLARRVGILLEDHAPALFGPEARALWDASAEHGTTADYAPAFSG